MSEHELLLRHASNWASQRQRVCDTELLETALELRLAHDGLPPTQWPAGSVEDLMLHRWPAHGHGVPNAQLFADSLDTFVRFLRTTGRMASGSADPRALAREAHRAAPKMAVACADPANFGPTKSLLAFGREAGFAVNDAGSVEELQTTLGQVMEAWNALPEEERRARLPLGEPASPLGFGGDSADSLDEQFLERGDPARAARQAQAAPLVRACLGLAEWVGARRGVTSTGVLKLAEAKAAYAELELWRWEQERREVLDSPPRRDPQAFFWRSAADCIPLERLWYAAQGAGLVDTRATVAKATGFVPRDDGEWAGLAVSLALGLWAIAESDGLMSVIPTLTVLGVCALEGSVAEAEVRAQWLQHDDNPLKEFTGDGEAAAVARYSDQDVALSLHFFADAGLWEVREGVYRLTDLGREFTTFLFSRLDSDGRLQGPG